jgi:hypothetical protein
MLKKSNDSCRGVVDIRIPGVEVFEAEASSLCGFVGTIDSSVSVGLGGKLAILDPVNCVLKLFALFSV